MTIPGHIYVARVHLRGAKTYEVVSRHRTKNAAIQAMAAAFVTDKGYPKINRADVIAVAKMPSYYGPTLVCEMRR